MAKRKSKRYGPPDKLRIVHEPDMSPAWFEHVGKLPDGRLFSGYVLAVYPDGYGLKWMTDPDRQKQKRILAILHLFDPDGHHLDTTTHLAGHDTGGIAVYREAQSELDRLGPVERGDIWVRLFRTTVDGVTHGLVYDTGGGEHEGVRVLPYDLVFRPPWDSGLYDT